MEIYYCDCKDLQIREVHNNNRPIEKKSQNRAGIKQRTKKHPVCPELSGKQDASV